MTRLHHITETCKRKKTEAEKFVPLLKRDPVIVVRLDHKTNFSENFQSSKFVQFCFFILIYFTVARYLRKVCGLRLNMIRITVRMSDSSAAAAALTRHVPFCTEGS